MIIYKYEIPGGDYFELELPMFAEILSVQKQKGKPYIWALVDEQNENFIRHFIVFGTGQKVEEPSIGELKYIGTFQLLEGSFVGHLFEHVL